MNHIAIKVTKLVVVALALAGCSETIEWEVDDNEPRLVVEGWISDEYKNHHVFLSATQDLYEEGVVPVSGATVAISDGENTFVLEESAETEGRYESGEAFAGEPGRTYELDIQLQEPVGGEQTFQASALMPHRLEFDSVRVVKETFFGEEEYVVKAFGENPENTVDYYFIHVYRNGERLTDDLQEVVLFDDEEIEGFEFDDFNLYSNEEDIEAGDRIMVEVRSVTEDYYAYYFRLLSSHGGGDPFGFSGPPANAYGNVSGNAFGYFYAAPVSSVEGVAQP